MNNLVPAIIKKTWYQLMEDIPIAKGGRGRVAPYSTCHYRIPQPIKPTVEKLAGAYRLCIEEVREPEAMLKRVEQAIDPKAPTLAPSALEDRHEIAQLQRKIAELEEQNEILAKLLNHARREKQESLEAAEQTINQNQVTIGGLNKELWEAKQAIASQVSSQENDLGLEQENLELHVKVGDLDLALENAKEEIEALNGRISYLFEVQASNNKPSAAPPPEQVTPANWVSSNIREVERLLKDALALKANAGGAIKAKIREALPLIY